jgi:hypothetical protein
MNYESDMRSMITKAAKLNKNDNTFTDSVKRPWRPHIQPKEATWKRMQWTLRSMECRSGGLAPTTAKKVATTILTPIIHYSAEIWHHNGDENNEIDEAAIDTWGSILGVSRHGTKYAAMRAELGVLSMVGQRDIQSLAYYNRILNMPTSRLTRQIFDWLATNHGGTEATEAQANWVTTTIPKILRKYNMPKPEAGIDKKQWRKTVTEEVLKLEDNALQAELKKAAQQASTLADLHTYGSRIDGSEPDYIQVRNCWAANRGREIKTRFRLKGKYAFVTDNETRQAASTGRACPCCGHGADTPFHFTMQCQCFKEERQTMNDRISAAISQNDNFGYALKTNNQRFAILMSAGVSPQSDDFAAWRELELALYHFLGTADTKRKQILADRLTDRRGAIPL